MGHAGSDQSHDDEQPSQQSDQQQSNQQSNDIPSDSGPPSSPHDVDDSQLSRAPLRPHAGGTRSLTRRLINRRRRRLHVGALAAVQHALMVTVVGALAFIIIFGGVGVGYVYADAAKYHVAIVELGLSQNLRSSRIYDRHGTLLYQTQGQNTDHRFPLNYCQLPEVVKWATIDTEDHNFWNESIGIDPVALLRATAANLNHASATQGGSTITQQLVKLAVLGDASQNLGRKFDEAILADKVSRLYTRQDVLTMYLNIVPYGFNNDGIEAAAIAYFHKKAIPIALNDQNQAIDPQYQAYTTQYVQCANDQGIPIRDHTITLPATWQLAPWQATLLTGVPNNPNTYNPYLHPQAATERQRDGVLIQMAKYGHQNFLTIPDGKGGEILSTKDGVYHYTLDHIFTPTDLPPSIPTVPPGYVRQIYANAYEGTNGIPELAPFFVEDVIDQLSNYFPDGREGFATAGWNVYTTLDYGTPVSDAQLDRTSFGLDGKLHVANYDPQKEGDWLAGVGLQQYADYVTRRDITRTFPDYWDCGSANQVPNTAKDATQNPFAAAQGSCWLRPLNAPYTNVGDGAVAAIDPRNGDVLAMVGGVDYAGVGNPATDGAENNVAESGVRSMGSAFKPIVYATALEMGWTPGTIVRDQPTCFPVGGGSNTSEARPADKLLCPGNYLPHNFEDVSWAGPQPIQYELGNSLNTPAELALSFVGLRAAVRGNPTPLIPMARRLGIHTLSTYAIGPSTALGTLGVSLLELTSAYGTFANAGRHENTRFVLQVTTPNGAPAKDGYGQVRYPSVAQPSGYQAISPQTAYMMTSMLDDNDARAGNFGSDNPLHFPGRDVAAKTGTGDALRNIVTAGYTPWLALGVWAGNANNDAMHNVSGITGAAYIFHDVMAYAMQRLSMPGPTASVKPNVSTNAPGGYFAVPPGLHRAILNCHTGLAPWRGQDVTQATCDPSTQERVPAALTPEFDHCDFLHPGKLPTVKPNATEKCAQQSGYSGAAGDAVNAAWDGWWCLSWGCSAHDVRDAGADIVWLPDGQDPTVP